MPEKMGEELWLVAAAELVEESRAEFAEALETLRARANYGLDMERQANERLREAFWWGLHVEELAIARGCALGAGIRVAALSCAI